MMIKLKLIVIIKMFVKRHSHNPKQKFKKIRYLNKLAGGVLICDLKYYFPNK